MLHARRIVLVEDDEIMGGSLVQRLSLEGAEVQWHRHMARALPAIRSPRRPLDAVVCDIRLPDGSGEELFRTLLRTATPPPFLFITGQGDVAQAVRLIRSGAADYITKPFEMRAFLERVAQVVGLGGGVMPEQTGISRQALAVDRQAREAAESEAPLLIRGGPGLGKARLGRFVHERSDRRAAPLVVRDALSSPLDAAALAVAAREAGEGTLLIVGVGRLLPDAQDALAGLLRDGAPLRLIATAGMRLRERVAAGGFRADLHDRLGERTIVVPPLAERPEDAVWLAGRLFAALNGGRRQGLSAAAEEAIRAHDWPGNGRELRARIARAIAAAEGPLLLPSDLFPEPAGEAGLRPLAEVRDAAERAHIAAALARTGGQVAEAARLLRISRTTLWEKMQKFGL
jgi:DNA-binding NtrC family response regulator